MQPKIYTSNTHHIRNDLIDSHALAVLEKLQSAGFTSYLVGGSVRDLLMRKKPKDYDISTSAKPEEVKALFRNCILVGRRFLLAHVRFGRHIIEVSTFRAGDPADDELIVRDNIWGSPEEDVMRRDFTINGLFYDALDHKIIDYVDGFNDLQQHFLRVIGDPLVRFKQDPVRMLRMQKFRARFGFHVDAQALEALSKCRSEITKSFPARVLEEIFRMLESGASESFFRLIVESKLLDLLFPKLAEYFHQESGEKIYAYLKAADAMNQKGQYRALDRGILTAALLFPILDDQIEREFLSQDKTPQMQEILNLVGSLIHDILFQAYSHFPRKIRLACHFILQMQYRLTPLDNKKRPRTRIVRQKGFAQALTFLKLRALIQPELFKNYEQWKRILRKYEEEESK